MSRKFTWSIFVSVVLFVFSSAGFAAGDAAAGKDKAVTCSSCHGIDGKGTKPNPNIAGMNVGKFTTAMKAYKTGERKNPMMGMFAKKLSDKDIEDLAAYFAAK
jgi:cytochrome c553